MLRTNHTQGFEFRKSLKRILVITVLYESKARLYSMDYGTKNSLTLKHENLLGTDTPAIILGHNVKRLRKEAKITKHRFALMVGIGRPFLDRIEEGSADPRLSVIVNLAEALESTPQELLSSNTPPTSLGGEALSSFPHASL